MGGNDFCFDRFFLILLSGVLLFFREIEPARVVLKPQWLFAVLTNVFFFFFFFFLLSTHKHIITLQVISPKHQFCKEDGILKIGDLPHLWKGLVSQADYPFLLGLKFSQIYI